MGHLFPVVLVKRRFILVPKQESVFSLSRETSGTPHCCLESANQSR